MLLACSLCSSASRAQTPSPMAEWQYAAGIALMPFFVDEPPKWQVALGLGAGMTPLYEGSAKYQFQPGPIISVRYRDLAFFTLGEGLGINLLSGKGYRAGAALAFDLGRKEDDDSRLAALGDIQPAPELKLFGEYVIFPVVLRANLRHATGGHNGWLGDVSAYMPVAGSRKFFVFVGPSVTFADAGYMQTYFGITPQQSLNTEYAVYTPGGGIKSAKFGVNATWFFSEDWFLQGIAAAERLYGNAAESPILQTREQYTGSAYVGYTF